MLDLQASMEIHPVAVLDRPLAVGPTRQRVKEASKATDFKLLEYKSPPCCYLYDYTLRTSFMPVLWISYDRLRRWNR